MFRIWLIQSRSRGSDIQLICRVSKHPLGSMTSNEEEKNEYIVTKYNERLNYMFANNQVGFG